MKKVALAIAATVMTTSAIAGGGHGHSKPGPKHGEWQGENQCIEQYRGRSATTLCSQPYFEYWVEKQHGGAVGARIDWTVPSQVYNEVDSSPRQFGVVAEWRDEVLFERKGGEEITYNTFDWSCDEGKQWSVKTAYAYGKKKGKKHHDVGHHDGFGIDQDGDDRHGGDYKSKKGKGGVYVKWQKWFLESCTTNTV